MRNLLPFWLAKQMFALAKYTWFLYYQWRHPPPSPPKSEESGKDPSCEGASAKLAKRTKEGVNGGISNKDSNELSEEESSKENTSDNRTDDDKGSKVKRRRGKWVPEELRTFAKKEEEKPYIPPAYYCEDEEEELNSDEEDNDKFGEGSSSSDHDVEEMSQVDKSAVVNTVDAPQSHHNGVTSEEVAIEQQSKSVGEVRKVKDKSTRHVEDVEIAREKNIEEQKSELGENGTMSCEDDRPSGAGHIVYVSNPKDGAPSLSWSRYQQKQLEWALVQYPKFAKDRWDNIAKAVPGKSKVYMSSDTNINAGIAIGPGFPLICSFYVLVSKN